MAWMPDRGTWNAIFYLSKMNQKLGQIQEAGSTDRNVGQRGPSDSVRGPAKFLKKRAERTTVLENFENADRGGPQTSEIKNSNFKKSLMVEMKYRLNSLKFCSKGPSGDRFTFLFFNSHKR